MILKRKIDLAIQFKEYPQSKFGVVRKHDIHTGIDIYCEINDEVFSVLDGTIIDIGIFTGEKVSSPWWNETGYIEINHGYFYILYGEIKVIPELKVGDKIEKDTLLGNVQKILKKENTKNPPTMIHLEFYSRYNEPTEWSLGRDKPQNLLNPMDFIELLFS